MKKLIFGIILISGIILQGCVTGKSDYDTDYFGYTSNRQLKEKNNIQAETITYYDDVNDDQDININNFNGGIIGTDIFAPSYSTTETDNNGNTIVNNYYINNNGYNGYYNWRYPYYWRRGVYITVGGCGWPYWDPWYDPWYYRPYYSYYWYDPYYNPYYYGYYSPYYYRHHHSIFDHHHHYDKPGYMPKASEYVAKPRPTIRTTGVSSGSYTNNGGNNSYNNTKYGTNRSSAEASSTRSTSASSTRTSVAKESINTTKENWIHRYRGQTNGY